MEIREICQLRFIILEIKEDMYNLGTSWEQPIATSDIDAIGFTLCSHKSLAEYGDSCCFRRNVVEKVLFL